MNVQRSDKVIFGVATLVIAAASAFGFYLIEGEVAIRNLVTSGHNHILSFAYGGILFGFLMRLLDLPERKKYALALWMSATYAGPLALIWAGLSGNAWFLTYTSPVFEGSFVVLWLIMAYRLWKRRAL